MCLMTRACTPDAHALAHAFADARAHDRTDAGADAVADACTHTRFARVSHSLFLIHIYNLLCCVVRIHATHVFAGADASADRRAHASAVAAAWCVTVCRMCMRNVSCDS
jgi:hypothetical protein